MTTRCTLQEQATVAQSPLLTGFAVAASDLEVVSTAIAAINTALDYLYGKAPPEEIGEYKAFIYPCANAVANAVGKGLFGSGIKVSEQEALTLAKIRTALAI